VSVRLKICGVANERDAQEAAHLGADALGIPMDGAPGSVTPEEAVQLALRLPPLLTCVAVFRRTTPARTVRAAAAEARIRVVQIGEDSGMAPASQGDPARIVSIGAGRASDAARLGRIPAAALRLALSPPSAGARELPPDWTCARGAARVCRVVIGGLADPAALAEAIGYVRPYGVDLLEGCEYTPGQLDVDRLEALAVSARTATALLESERVWSR